MPPNSPGGGSASPCCLTNRSLQRNVEREMPEDTTENAHAPHLLRRLGLLQATALNMTNMIGIGPFITIPLLMSALNGGGPQAMLGWIVAVVIALADGIG